MLPQSSGLQENALPIVELTFKPGNDGGLRPYIRALIENKTAEGTVLRGQGLYAGISSFDLLKGDI